MPRVGRTLNRYACFDRRPGDAGELRIHIPLPGEEDGHERHPVKVHACTAAFLRIGDTFQDLTDDRADLL